jgi:predicted RNA-binding protein Jag
MKSIIEEATSVIKAVEVAWTRAGNPEEFSIKVFELPQKNFFGITTKKAKIGIFFNEEGLIPSTTQPKEKKEYSPKKQLTPAAQGQPKAPTPAPRPQREPRRTAQPKAKPVQKSNPEPVQSQEYVQEQSIAAIEQWTPEIVAVVEDWIKQSLSLMGLPNVAYNASAHGAVLQFTFAAPVVEDLAKERQLFRSFIYLIMAFLRNKYKADIRPLKLRLDHRVSDEKSSPAL